MSGSCRYCWLVLLVTATNLYVAQDTPMVPSFNPEMSCPMAVQVDWPAVKRRILSYSEKDVFTRRGYESDEIHLEWRRWIAGVYTSEDLDTCPMGVQSVHAADVDRRLFQFGIKDLAEVFAAQYEHFMVKIPLFLAALSGWPIFKLYGQLADAIRLRTNYTSWPVDRLCSVAWDDALAVSRKIFDGSATATDVFIPTNRILTAIGMESAHDVDCKMAKAFAHLAQAVILSTHDATSGTPEGLQRFYERMVSRVEDGEKALYQAIETEFQERKDGGILYTFASGWPIWQLLDRLQIEFSRPPWSLPCKDTDSLMICPACAAPKQIEWAREKFYVALIVSSASRGEFLKRLDTQFVAGTDAESEAGSVAAVRAQRLQISAPLGCGGYRCDEAWATLLSEDDADFGRSEEMLLTYLEVVRVMAHSVRRQEGCQIRSFSSAKDTSNYKQECRPFLVLISADMLTSKVQEILKLDGLTPLGLPTFASEGIQVPLRKDPRPISESTPGLADAPGLFAPKARELSWWMKIRLWSFTQYRRIVYIDADILVRRPISELFSLPAEVTFAAPVHPSKGKSSSEVSVGIMSLRPDKSVYDAMVAFLLEAGAKLQTGVRSVDQMLQHAFFTRHFTTKGHPRWNVGSGEFIDCADTAPELYKVPHIDDMEFTSPSLQGNNLGTMCTLPLRYDFCVSYPSLAGIQNDQELESRFAAQFALSDSERGQGTWDASLLARVLHWTGPRRKPWMHWLSLARTRFDDLWWETHADLCSGSREKSCRIQCEG